MIASQFSNVSTGLITFLVEGIDRWNETYFKDSYRIINSNSPYNSSTTSSFYNRKDPVQRTYNSSSSSQADITSQHPQSNTEEQIDQLLEEDFILQLMKSRVLPGISSKFDISKCIINPLKVSRRAGIATIEYRLTQIPGTQSEEESISQSFIGKWRRDGSLRQVFDNLTVLWSPGLWRDRSYESDLRICRPIAYFSEYNLMLTSNAYGVQLEDFLAHGDTNPNLIRTAVTQSAKWLAKLHSTTAALCQNIFSFKDEEERLYKWRDHLSALYPPFAGRIGELSSQILEEQRKLDPMSFVFIHGDFHPLNILVDEDHLTVVDFEHSCLFDPAKDLGYFISYLLMRREKYGLSLDIEALQKIFLRKYVEEMSSSVEAQGSLKRVDLYKCRSYLQHLHFRYWTLKRRLDESYLRYWVTEAEKCIEAHLNQKCHA